MKKCLIIFGAVLLLVIGCDLALARSVNENGKENAKDSAQELKESKEAQEHTFEEIDRLIRGGKTDEALRLLEQVDHESAEYFYLKEIAYIEDGSEKANEELARLYQEAADRWPKWQHMQKMAGVAAIYEGNYESAGYRLFQTLQLDMEDAETWYYLGVLSYYKGNYEDMRMYFEHALERNLSEKKQNEILWYAEQVGDRE